MSTDMLDRLRDRVRYAAPRTQSRVITTLAVITTVIALALTSLLHGTASAFVSGAAWGLAGALIVRDLIGRRRR